MSFTTLLGAIAIVSLGTLQYLLMYNALRDLARRSRVRGNNKVSWMLIILCLPFVGALLYGWMGPTSFLRRPSPVIQTPTATITPITRAPSVRSRRTEQPQPTRIRRTGS